MKGKYSPSVLIGATITAVGQTFLPSGVETILTFVSPSIGDGKTLLFLIIPQEDEPSELIILNMDEYDEYKKTGDIQY